MRKHDELFAERADVAADELRALRVERLQSEHAQAGIRSVLEVLGFDPATRRQRRTAPVKEV